MKFSTFPDLKKNIKKKSVKDIEYISYAIKLPRIGDVTIPSVRNSFNLLKLFIRNWISKTKAVHNNQVSIYMRAMTDSFGITSIEESQKNRFENDAIKSKICFICLTPEIQYVKCPVCQLEVKSTFEKRLVSCKSCGNSFQF